jgi:hypothetical protein
MSDTPPRANLPFGLDLGQLVTLGGIVIVFIGSIYVGNYRLAEVERDMIDFRRFILEHQTVLERQTEYQRRITALEERFDRLEQRK